VWSKVHAFVMPLHACANYLLLFSQPKKDVTIALFQVPPQLLGHIYRCMNNGDENLESQM